MYGYANGDPVNFSDPFGLCPPQDNNPYDCPGKMGAFVMLGQMAPAINREVATFLPKNAAAAVGGLALGRVAAAVMTRLGVGVSAVARQIAGGHAWTKHGSEFAEFGIRTSAQLGKHVDDVMSGAKGADVKSLARGRKAYWDSETGSVVIRDPKNVDGGTVFVPKGGREFFDALR